MEDDENKEKNKATKGTNNSPSTIMEEEPSLPPPQRQEDNDTNNNATTTARMQQDDDGGVDGDPHGVGVRGKPRLVIRQMILENFKSYGGERVIGPFHKSFSAVVGPNGSGKSNVIDALLFVFGKRAAQLRLKRVSELIHASASVDERPAQAKVSVFFHEIIDTGNDDEEYEIVPDSEVVLSRIARRDNTSTYQWNGRNQPMSEIAKYLNSRGVDLQHNRFLILQGEVEQISLMPPKAKDDNTSGGGLLEYLEDMIGSHQFVPATLEAAAKVEECSVARQEALGRLQAVSREKEGLQAAQAEARALLQAEASLRSARHLLAQCQKHTYDTQVEQLTDKRQGAATRLEETRHDLQEATQQHAEYVAQRKESQTAYDKIYEELFTTQEEFQAYERKDIQLRANASHAKKQVTKFQKAVKQAETQYTTAQEAVTKAHTEIPQLEKERETLVTQQTEATARRDELWQARATETQALRQELDDTTTALAPLQEAKSTAAARLSTAETAVQLATSARQQMETQLEAAKTELAQLDEHQATQQASLQELREALQQQGTQKEALVQEDVVLQEKETHVARKHKTLVARVEESKAAMASKGGRQNRSRAVQGLLKASRPGGPLAKVGLLGRLGDLAAIHADYDVAISTACGSLDHLVVQTTAGAQRCLDFLRQHELGRANFIPLDKMKKGAHDRVVTTPEDAPRLFDLLQYKQPALAPALYLAVGNTLVAPDMETATRWAYEYEQRWRVVTMDGKLIETSGTMAGGGKSVKKGGMRLTNVKKVAVTEDDEEMEQAATDVEQLEKELKMATELLQQIRQRRKEIQSELRQLAKDIKSGQARMPKLELSIGNCDTTRENLTNLIPQLEQQLLEHESDEAKLAELEATVAECQKELEVCASKAAKLEKQKDKLQKAILEAGGSEWKQQEAKCKKLQQDLDSMEKKIRAAKVSITTNEKNMSKADKAKEKALEQLAASKEEVEQHQVDLKALEKDATAVMNAYEKVKALEADKKQELEEAEKQFETLKKSQSAAKCAEIEILGQLEALDKQLQDYQSKGDHWQAEMTKLEQAAQKDAEEWGEISEDEESDDENGDDNTEEKTAEEAETMNEHGGVEETKMETDEVDESKTEADEESNGDVDMQENSKQKQKSNSSSIFPIYTPTVLSRHNRDAIKENIAVLETERNTIAKNANLGAIAEYRKKESEYLTRVSELDAITEERNGHRRTYEDLRRKRLEMFMDGFGEITLKLKEMYQMITLGGDAELELVDSLDPFSEGIVFSVRPPKKSWKNISNLSGGEKTLSSLALVFALHHYKPTPLYVMDEIDAALDFKNVSIVANYIKERTRNAQFVIISLRNNMFELADRLVGIYKTDNITKSVTINPRAFGIESQQNGLLATTPALLNRTNKRLSSAAKESARRRLTIHSESSDRESIENTEE